MVEPQRRPGLLRRLVFEVGVCRVRLEKMAHEKFGHHTMVPRSRSDRRICVYCGRPVA